MVIEGQPLADAVRYWRVSALATGLRVNTLYLADCLQRTDYPGAREAVHDIHTLTRELEMRQIDAP